MVSLARCQGGVHVEFSESILLNIVRVWYIHAEIGSVLWPFTSVNTTSFDLMFAPFGHRVCMICDVKPPRDCSLGNPQSISNWYFGMAFVWMSLARASKP